MFELSTLRNIKCFNLSKSELLYDWRFTVNRFVLVPSPLRLTIRELFFFLQLNLCGYSPYVTFSPGQAEYAWSYIKCTYRIYIYSMSLKILPFALHTSPVSQDFTKQIMPILRILRYNGSLVTWTVVSLTTAKFKPLIFSMSGFTLSYTANFLFVFWRRKLQTKGSRDRLFSLLTLSVVLSRKLAYGILVSDARAGCACV
jgi:hypothetical protein